MIYVLSTPDTEFKYVLPKHKISILLQNMAVMAMFFCTRNFLSKNFLMWSLGVRIDLYAPDNEGGVVRIYRAQLNEGSKSSSTLASIAMCIFVNWQTNFTSAKEQSDAI